MAADVEAINPSGIFTTPDELATAYASLVTEEYSPMELKTLFSSFENTQVYPVFKDFQKNFFIDRRSAFKQLINDHRNLLNKQTRSESRFSSRFSDTISFLHIQEIILLVFLVPLKQIPLFMKEEGGYMKDLVEARLTVGR